MTPALLACRCKRVVAAAAVGILFLAGASRPDSARAQEADHRETTSWEVVCADAETVMEMNRCSRLRYEAADSVLHGVYLRALDTIANTGFGPDLERQWNEGLRKAQRLWEETRAADCGLVSLFEWRGGSGATGAEYECLTMVTEQRTALLQSRYMDGR